jgi:hypothetical protein
MQGAKPDVGVEKKFHSRNALMSASSTIGAAMSSKICMESFMEPIQLLLAIRRRRYNLGDGLSEARDAKWLIRLP